MYFTWKSQRSNWPGGRKLISRYFVVFHEESFVEFVWQDLFQQRRNSLADRADRVTQTRRWVLYQAFNQASDCQRISSIVFFFFKHRQRFPKTFRVWRVVLRLARKFAVCRELGSEISRLHQHHANPEREHLHPHSLGHAFKSKLAGTVEPLKRQGNQPGNRADIYD